jgi:hypothetical protein
MKVQMRVYTQNIHNSSTHSHASEEENRTTNRSTLWLLPIFVYVILCVRAYR